MYSESKCFRMLGVGRHASLEDVRRAYRGLALDLHPDRPGGDEERFKEITAAYNQIVQRLSRGGGPRLRKDGSRKGKVWSTSERRTNHGNHHNGGSWQKWRPDGKSEAASGSDARFHGRADKTSKARRAASKSRVHSKVEPGPRATPTSGPRVERTKKASQARKARRQNWTAPTRKPVTEPPPNHEPEQKMNDDLASAWKAWCATARSYQEEHGTEESASQDVFDETEYGSEPTVEEPMSPSETGGFMGWIRKGLNKFKPGAAQRVSSHDMYLRLRVNESTLLYGGQHRIAIHRDGLCPSCLGTGSESCICSGTGRVKVRDVVTVTVPPGARTGSQLRLEGKGTAGRPGERDGDLFLQLEPAEFSGFRREDLDLHGVFSVPASVARGGGVVEVDLPRGEVKVHVPPGTRSGDKFRLRGLGVPAWRREGTGDIYLAVMLN